MTLIELLGLICNQAYVFTSIKDDMYYGERTMKEVQRIYINASDTYLMLRKNYP